jgi:L-lysine 6-transaminase
MPKPPPDAVDPAAPPLESVSPVPRAFPGPQAAALLAELEHYVRAEPRPFALDLRRGHGMFLVTVDGQELFDWAGYFGAKLIAHNHPRLYEPAYAERLLTAANNKIANPDFLTPECVAYYRALYELAPRCMVGPDLEVYVVNSGAEAVENMMKYLINLHRERLKAQGKREGVRRFVYFDQAFHGRTVFALNVTRLRQDPTMTKDFHGIVPDNIQAPYPYLDTSRPRAESERRVTDSLEFIEAVLRERGDEVVAVIVEPLQGAGGHRMAPAEFFPKLSLLCHRYGTQLGFDEVQTAGGQTGTFFAIDGLALPHSPQAVASGKKLGNGVVYMQRTMNDRGILDSTWGGALADMVRFVQELDIVRQERLIEAVPAKAKRLIGALESLAQDFPSLIYNVRGLGLYQGFSLRHVEHKALLVQRALEREQLLLLGAGTRSIRLRPHLNVTDADIDELAVRLRRLLMGF